MAFDLSSSGRRSAIRPSMNVTPLVDVVLVLLIIFMVVTPMLMKQVWMNVPPKSQDDAPPPPADAQPPIVLTLDLAGVTQINGDIVTGPELVETVKRMLNARADKVVFFDAASDVPYERAVEVMDVLKGGGVETVAVLAEELK